MAHGGLRGTPYSAVRGLLAWADGIWTFINGKALLTGCNLGELWDRDFIDVMSEMFIQDGMIEHAKERDQARAALLSKSRDYNSTESYGMTNDDAGYQSDGPLPYLEPTEQSADGYAGLDPPLGG